jgi:hypothetical protein
VLIALRDMMRNETELAYFTRRAAQARVLAERALDTSVRKTHLALAALYDARVAALSAGEPVQLAVVRPS